MKKEMELKWIQEIAKKGTGVFTVNSITKEAELIRQKKSKLSSHQRQLVLWVDQEEIRKPNKEKENA